MSKCIILAACGLLAVASEALAVEVSFDGYIDLRLVVPPKEVGWVDGGLGKTRFGGDQPSPNFRIAEAIGQGTVAVTNDLHAVAVLRLEPEQRTGVDILETYVTWHPEAVGDWRWTVKAGAFFPSISVENDDLGWTSPYTLTPSAINSWVGNELRTIGGESALAWSGGYGTFTAVGSLFCCNEPAGVLMAERGWTLDDRPTALFERVRIPDATAKLYGIPGPSRTGMFENIDGRIGRYGGVKWDIPGIGQIAILNYDNDADPDAFTSRDASWFTRFWAMSLKTRILGMAMLAQGMTGDTTIGDNAGDYFTTDFRSAFALASYDFGSWRVSGRGDVFETRNWPSFPLMDESGHSFTAAVSWYPRDCLRLTAELLLVDSRRGETGAQANTQFQLSVRTFL